MPARDYEILYIIKPDLEDDAVHETVASVDGLIKSFSGTTLKTEHWGRRKLAYEVQHLREGHYVLTDFRLDPERVPELERALRIHDAVFRHLITRKPERVRRGPRRGVAGTPVAAGADTVAEDAAATDADDVAAVGDEAVRSENAAAEEEKDSSLAVSGLREGE